MAFEGLLAKFGSSAVRELGPHLPRLIGGVVEGFRKDSSATRDTIGAEIASLGTAHSSLASSMDRQAEAMDRLQNQLVEIDRKLDHALHDHGILSEQIGTQQKQLQTLRLLCVFMVVLLVVLFGAGAAFYLAHK